MAEMNQDGMKLGERLRHAFNVFRGKDQSIIQSQNIGASYSTRPDRIRYHDVSRIQIRHVKTDEEDRYVETVDSGLNYCLNVEANIDQTAQSFKQDLVMSMLDEGVVAAVPVDTTFDPKKTGSYDIRTLRTAKILEWYPQHVKINVYNDRTGLKEDIIVPKASTVIIENPLYAVMNEPISTLKRLPGFSGTCLHRNRAHQPVSCQKTRETCRSAALDRNL